MSTHTTTFTPPSACPLRSTATQVKSGGVGGAAAMLYGVIAYMAFFVWFLYAVGWLGNWLVPKSIDSGATGDAASSLLVNAGLIALFALQHTVMARPAFKRWWTRIVPASVERSTFVLVAAAAMWLVVLAWQPLPATIWSVSSPVATWALVGLSMAGWGLALVSTFLINHFDLFGLRQVWARLTGRVYRPVGFRLSGPYRLVRHPLMLGFLVAFWATPHMTVGHMQFAIMFTGYILMGTWFEERDLVAEHGEKYLDYRRSVRGFVPVPRRAA